jgi:hypothetical protein
MHMPEWALNLTPTENVGRGFILRSTLPAQWVVSQPHQLEVSAQGIMTGKKSGNHPPPTTSHTRRSYYTPTLMLVDYRHNT